MNTNRFTKSEQNTNNNNNNIQLNEKNNTSDNKDSIINISYVSCDHHNQRMI